VYGFALQCATMHSKKLDVPTNVRLSCDSKRELRSCSRRLGISLSDLIRAAVAAKLRDCQTRGLLVVSEVVSTKIMSRNGDGNAWTRKTGRQERG
jgi:hypothetical protein